MAKMAMARFGCGSGAVTRSVKLNALLSLPSAPSMIFGSRLECLSTNLLTNENVEFNLLNRWLVTQLKSQCEQSQPPARR
jgi:hypothetical protein